MLEDRDIRPILVVEDNDEDFEVVRQALLEGDPNPRNIIRCPDGHELLEYLFGTGRYEGPEPPIRPAFVILDLNLPGLGGREVLRRIKSNFKLKEIPIVVMTVSNDQRDIERCYDAGANTLVAKPMLWDEFFSTVARLKDYWLNVALLPEADA